MIEKLLKSQQGGQHLNAIVDKATLCDSDLDLFPLSSRLQHAFSLDTQESGAYGI